MINTVKRGKGIPTDKNIIPYQFGLDNVSGDLYLNNPVGREGNGEIVYIGGNRTILKISGLQQELDETQEYITGLSGAVIHKDAIRRSAGGKREIVTGVDLTNVSAESGFLTTYKVDVDTDEAVNYSGLITLDHGLEFKGGYPNGYGISAEKIDTFIKAVSGDLDDLETRLPGIALTGISISGKSPESNELDIQNGSVVWYLNYRDIIAGTSHTISGQVDIFTQTEAEELKKEIMRDLAVTKTYKVDKIAPPADPSVPSYAELNDLIDEIIKNGKGAITKQDLSGIKVIVVSDGNHPYSGDHDPADPYESWLYYYTCNPDDTESWTAVVRIDGQVHPVDGTSGIQVITAADGEKDLIGITQELSGYIKRIEDTANAAIPRALIRESPTSATTKGREVLTGVALEKFENNSAKFVQYKSDVNEYKESNYTATVKAISGLTFTADEANPLAPEITLSAQPSLDYTTKVSGDLTNEIIRAIAKESGISGDLSGEIWRAEKMEKAISGDLDAEIDRAIDREDTISGDLSGEIYDRFMGDIKSAVFSNTWVSADKASGILLTLTNNKEESISGLIDNNVIFDEGTWD
jgi:hypothetical protein